MSEKQGVFVCFDILRSHNIVPVVLTNKIPRPINENQLTTFVYRLSIHIEKSQSVCLPGPPEDWKGPAGILPPETRRLKGESHEKLMRAHSRRVFYVGAGCAIH